MNKRPTLKFHIQQTICSDEGQKNAGNVSFSIPVRWSIYIVNSVMNQIFVFHRPDQTCLMTRDRDMRYLSRDCDIQQTRSDLLA